MKYMVHFPVYLDCPLKCEYCFHQAEFKRGSLGGPNFSVAEYNAFVNTHLKGQEILINFHGGEPFTDKNINLICTVLDETDCNFELLTNGLGSYENYAKILPYVNRIDRIGFTFHRKVIGKNEAAVNTFIRNVAFLKACVDNVYVKELLFVEEREAILENKKFWNDKGIDFKIQDFKGTDRGRSWEDFKKYSEADINLIDPEYVKDGVFCACRAGYKNVIIRGGWQAGDILACWEDPAVIGNIQQNTYNPHYCVIRDFANECIDVITKDATGSVLRNKYKGTYYKDLYKAKRGK